MHYVKGIKAYKSEKRSAVTLGKFDGLHRGHEKLVKRVEALGVEEDIESVVCAFDMSSLLKRINPSAKMLMTKKERAIRLAGRVDYLVDCPFTEELSRMEAEDFIKDVLADTFRAKYVVVGSDFCFGHKKRGNIHMLAEYEEQYDYKLIVIEKERYYDREISSSYIKEVLSEGDIQLAGELLGYPYTVTGVVSHGKKLGRTLGFPTFNVVPDEWKMMPPNGVYLNRVQVDGVWYDAIGNVGVKPTVTDSGQILVESFLMDYEGDAYGKEVVIELGKFQRPEKKFSSIDEMKQCIDQDIINAKEFFENKK